MEVGAADCAPRPFRSSLAARLLRKFNCSEGPIFPSHLGDPNGNLIGINKPLAVEEWSDELRREAGQDR
jgi:hypothetical protein